jgi:hypothetical protein
MIVVVTSDEPTPVVVTPAGPRGPAATIVIDSVETLAAGEDATVENVGTEQAAEFIFGIPAGPAPVLTFDTTITGAPGSDAAVSVTEGLPGNYGLQFTVPRGSAGTPGVNAYLYVAYASDDSGTDFTLTFDDSLHYMAFLHSTEPIVTPVVGDFAGLWRNTRGPVGPMPTVAAGTVTTGDPGTDADVTITETTPGDYVIDFTIPRGDAGDLAASGIEFTPAGTLSSDNVQDALEELSSEKIQVGDAATQLAMATARILGRATAGAGAVEELTASQLRTLASLYSIAQADAADTAWYGAAVMRGNHSGSQLAATISDFNTAADLRVALGAKPKNVGYTAKTDTFTTTSTSWTDLTGLSVTITPSSASSRILILVQLTIGTLATSTQARAKILRDSTDVTLGAAEGSRTQAHTWLTSDAQPSSMFLMAVDSPATTSATTYKIQLQTNSGTIYVNRSESDTDNSVSTRGVSTITVMEIV